LNFYFFLLLLLPPAGRRTSARASKVEAVAALEGNLDLAGCHLWPVTEVRRPVGGRRRRRKREKEYQKKKKIKKQKILLKVINVNVDQPMSAGWRLVSKIRPKLPGND